jgi:glycosyltransferase involved in cell wall biosynthesis
MKQSSQKPRVLIDTFHLYQALTGIRTYTTQLCEAAELNQAQLECEYYTFPNWRKADQSNWLRGYGSRFKKAFNHFIFFLWKQFILPAYIWRHNIDVVVSPDFVVPYFRFNALGMPVIHDTFFWDMPTNYNPIWRPYFIKMILAGMSGRSVLLATTDYIKLSIEERVTSDYPVEVLYQCAKDFDANISETSLLSQYDLSDQSYFLHVGVFDQRKNIQVLVEAFITYRQAGGDKKLVLVGERGLSVQHDSFIPIKAMIDHSTFSQEIIITGFISNQALKQIYNHAFAYVFPSLEEGFGIPVLEAFSHQLPVIISDQPALMEVANHSALIFERHDPKQLAARLHELSSEPLRKELITKGNKRLKHFSKEKFIKNLDQLIVNTL